jgi:acetyltransferase-like isoleucine patch superfamily enzyme
MKAWAVLTKKLCAAKRRFYTWHYRKIFKHVGKGTEFGGRIHYRFPERIVIGEHCTIAEEVFLDGRGDISIGSHVVLSPFASLMTGELDREKNEYLASPIHIADRVWIATHATVLRGVHIEEKALVAAGAVVTKDVSAGITVGGVPAKPLEAHRST